MESVATFVVFGAVVLFVVVGVMSLFTHNDAYEEIGAGGLSVGERPAQDFEVEPSAQSLQLERQQEIRQMLQARSERLVRRGGQALDIDAELVRLERSPAAENTQSAALVAEVRQLVIARNERRQRQGREPLDVEAEVQRTLRELDG
jgi:hypothetical protein